VFAIERMDLVRARGVVKMLELADGCTFGPAFKHRLHGARAHPWQSSTPPRACNTWIR
jgi:hypothetical protein